MKRALVGDLVPRLGIAAGRRYDVDVTSDANGFRTTETQADVVLIGDSFVVARAVPATQLVSAHLARSLDTSVANLGVDGYGPQQELAVLQRHGLPMKPELVIWFFSGVSDLADARRFDEFERAKAAGQTLTPSFGDRSFLWNAWRAASFGTAPVRENDSMLAARRSCYYPIRKAPENEWIYFGHDANPLVDVDAVHLVTDAIKKARLQSELRGAGFLLAYVPAKYRVFADYCETGKLTDLSGWEPDALPNELWRWADTAGIEFVDLTPALRASVAQGHSPYLPDDRHWNETAQRIVTRALLPAVHNQLRNRPPPLLRPTLDLGQRDRNCETWGRCSAARGHSWVPVGEAAATIRSGEPGNQARGVVAAGTAALELGIEAVDEGGGRGEAL